jgi:hypothetical protein
MYRQFADVPAEGWREPRIGAVVANANMAV